MLMIYFDLIFYIYVIYVCKIIYKMCCYYECIMNILIVSSRPRERGREGYQIYRTKETVNVLIPCSLIKRFPTQRANLQITIGAVPDPSLASCFRPAFSSRPDLRSRPDSRPDSSWSTIEEIQSSPPSYQDVLAGRFDSPVDQVEEEEIEEI